MTFAPGQSGNPSGRKVGSKNKLAKQFQEACEAADEKYSHPYLMMAEWANDESKPLEIRAAMLKECAAYRCVKQKQTLAVEQTVPIFSSEDQAEQFLAEFISAMAPDLEPAELTNMIRSWIISKREGKELELKVENQGHVPEQIVKIVGGLPALPGTHINMNKEPDAMNGIRAIDDVNSIPTQAKDPEP